MNTNKLFVLSGPSGVGKGTLAKMLIKNNPDISLSISCTTRTARAGEVDGKDYFFITKEEFLSKVEKGGFLEYSNHFDSYYGTPKDYVEETLKTSHVLLEIDVNGGLEVKKSTDSAKLIFIAPPSLEELRNRLIKRNTETAEKIEKRLSRLDYELSQKDCYDYVVVNDDLNKAYNEIIEIIEKEKRSAL